MLSGHKNIETYQYYAGRGSITKERVIRKKAMLEREMERNKSHNISIAPAFKMPSIHTVNELMDDSFERSMNAMMNVEIEDLGLDHPTSISESASISESDSKMKEIAECNSDSIVHPQLFPIPLETNMQEMNVRQNISMVQNVNMPVLLQNRNVSENSNSNSPAMNYNGYGPSIRVSNASENGRYTPLCNPKYVGEVIASLFQFH